MYKKVLIIVFFWLIVINIFALTSLNRFNLEPDTAYTWINPAEVFQTKSWDLVSLHCYWDCNWYLDIAQNGYVYEGDKLSNIVFFPLYPLLIKLISFFTLGNLIFAGWIISCTSLVFACIYLYKLVKQFHPNIDPVLPILFLLIFPTSFFLNAVYTEALFLFLSIACFYYCLRKNFLLAAVFGLLASLTRVTGFLLIIPVVFEYLRSNQFGSKKWSILSVLMIPLGPILFFVYHYLRFGDLFLFLKVESLWGRGFRLNADHFQLATNPAVVNFTFDIFYIALGLVLTVLIFKKLRISYALFMAVLIVVPLLSGTPMSIGRYLLPLFPIYIFLSSIKNEYFKWGWVFISLLLLAMNVTLFVNNYWAG